MRGRNVVWTKVSSTQLCEIYRNGKLALFKDNAMIQKYEYLRKKFAYTATDGLRLSLIRDEIRTKFTVHSYTKLPHMCSSKD